MPRSEPIRFGLRSPDGLTSSVWVCWVSGSPVKSDVYLSPRPCAKHLKISLHESGRWHVALNSEYFTELKQDKTWRDRDRYLDNWSRPLELSPGFTLAARIVFPWSAASNSEPTIGAGKKVSWVLAPPQGSAVEFDVILTSPDLRTTSWPGSAAMKTDLIGMRSLANGHVVWIVSRIVPMPPIGPMSGSFMPFDPTSSARLDSPCLRIALFGRDDNDGSLVVLDLPAVRSNTRDKPDTL